MMIKPEIKGKIIAAASVLVVHWGRVFVEGQAKSGIWPS